MELVDEDELHDIFRDCAAGAVPALGEAYGLDVIWDDELTQAPMVFIEAGDHRHLICLEQSQFSRLMQDKLHDHFSTERVRLKKREKTRSRKVSLVQEEMRL